MSRRILIITPAAASTRSGNRTTAARWARIFRLLGHRARLADQYDGQAADLLVALHARRSYPSIAAFHSQQAHRPLVLALTGTDLYHDIQRSPDAQRALQLATRLIVLQDKGLDALPAQHRAKTRVIYQSAASLRRRPIPRADVFEICVVGHLREVKDPFRAAWAVRLLPASSRILVTHLGAALDEAMAAQARRESQTNARYRWLADQPRPQARYILARSRLLVHTSTMEGGANVFSEALACDVPILSSRIPGSVGILGDDYPGYFEVGDTAALAHLLHRAETDMKYYEDLKLRCRARAPLVRPARERQTWRELLEELWNERPRPATPSAG